jgi:excisionase family DNA binding protein
MEQQFILHSTPVEELKNLIGGIVRDELRQFKPAQPETPDTEYLTRREVCALLKISAVTLYNWTKAGTLAGYRINGRVLYRTAEVKNALREISSLKYNRRA